MWFCHLENVIFFLLNRYVIFGATITIGFVMLEVLQHPSSLYRGVILQES